MTTNNANHSNLSTLINAAMNEATTSGNRSAALIVEMFASEMTFSKNAIINIMRKTGAERSAALDTLIGLVSDDFKALTNRYEVVTHKDHKAKLANDKAKEANSFEVQAINGKIKAARIMVSRAMSAVFYLRERNCTVLKLKKFGSSSSLLAKVDHEDADIGSVTITVSVAEMIRNGDKLLADATGKTKAATGRGSQAKNPVANAIADSSKALAAVLTGANSEKVKPITDFSNEVEQQLETTFRQLFAMKFLDGKTVDRKAVNEWINDTFVAPAAPATKSDKKAA